MSEETIEILYENDTGQFDVVVGLELRARPGENPLVMGLLAIFPEAGFGDRIVRPRNIVELALLFCEYPLRPCRVPEEEGWHGVANLPSDLWDELQAIVEERRKLPR